MNLSLPPATAIFTNRLPEPDKAILEAVFAKSLGAPFWRARKRSEVEAVFALGTKSQRFVVVAIDVENEVRLLILMNTPVAVVADPTLPEVKIADHALLGLTYPEGAIVADQPGMRFVEIIEPAGVFHPSVKFGRPQSLCLGASIRAGTPITELLISTFGALSLNVSIELDEQHNSALTANVEAAKFWQRQTDQLPLTHEPFYRVREEVANAN